jgi:hypothetical protein
MKSMYIQRITANHLYILMNEKSMHSLYIGPIEINRSTAQTQIRKTPLYPPAFLRPL